VLRSCRPEIVDRDLELRSLRWSPDGLLLEGLLLEGLLEGLLVGWLLRLCWLLEGLVRGKGLAPVVLSGLMPDLRGLDRRLVPDLRRRGEGRCEVRLGWVERSVVRGEAVLLLGGLAVCEGGVYGVRGEGVWRVSLLGVGVSVDGLLRPVGVCELR